MKMFFLSISALLLLSGCNNNTSTDQQINYENDVKPLIQTDEARKVHGSCNVIESKSVCMDFIGSVFTEERMKLSCAEGKFSLDACPYSDLGGCMATPGTITESIAWSYSTGGSPITPEEAAYGAKACNSLAMGRWVTPNSLLNN
jgi:hypothetical protein